MSKTPRPSGSTSPEDLKDSVDKCLVESERFELTFERSEDRSDAEQVESLLIATDWRIEDHKRRLRRLLDVYEVGGYTLEILLEKQHKRQEDVKQLEAERAQLLTLYDDAVAREAKACDIQHQATELAWRKERS